MANPIKPKYDFELDIATAHSRLSKKWKNRIWKWSEILTRCADTKRTGETVREYLRMSREEQSGIKDVGGFVGGYLSNGTRKTANVLYRTIVTLDIDYGTADVWDDFTMNFDCAAAIYSTHKHTKEKPRLRLLLPANRQMTPAEYEPVCRYWTAKIGIELFDHTTYQLPRLFYWPSTSRDGDFVFDYQDGPAFDVDKVLATYRNPQDVSEWPMSSREGDVLAHEIRKAGDPLEKPGLIGAFCRAYTIEDAIEKFLPDIYEKTGHDGRYTYRAGSVAGGCVTYENKFAFSHHDTDPASRQLCNAFDLVRIHKFGIEDEGTKVTDITRRPSYLKMQDFAATDKAVRVLLTKERIADADSDFADIDATEAPTEDANTDWMEHLDYDRKGALKSTINNIVAVLENDPGLKKHLYLDLLRNNISVVGGLPWDAKAASWGNRDDANLRGWLENAYDVTGKDKIKDALDMVITRHRRHPIREYFKGLVWDGVPRLERLIIDYAGAEDSRLNRAITRIHFTAAVARVMEPGCKYDYCLILAGPQGAGKSTLISIMGGEYYKDGLTSMEGKEGAEQVRGAHLIEIGELDGMKRSEISTVKQFITARSDEYRPAYAVHKEIFPRQCVFFGTTNEQYFLKDETGNRRFPIIPIKPELRKHGAQWFEQLIADRDQLWAEAVEYWKQGEKLYLPGDLEAEARQRQSEYTDNDTDELQAVLVAYLNTKLPTDWGSWDLMRRRAWLKNPDPLSEDGIIVRDSVCAAEFICERMGRDMTDKEYKYLSRKVCRMLDALGWERVGASRHAQALYGVQKAFKRPVSTEDESEI
ncbi:MAG: virulence-associated E family protein [Muribaculaceae bacterium]|nr:virulence-associated E family protein [Muribaculaceae bacterium]